MSQNLVRVYHSYLARNSPFVVGKIWPHWTLEEFEKKVQLVVGDYWNRVSLALGGFSFVGGGCDAGMRIEWLTRSWCWCSCHWLVVSCGFCCCQNQVWSLEEYYTFLLQHWSTIKVSNCAKKRMLLFFKNFTRYEYPHDEYHLSQIPLTLPQGLPWLKLNIHITDVLISRVVVLHQLTALLIRS